MEHSHTHKTYLPAAGRDWGLPLYDPLTKLLGTDRARHALLDQAALAPATRVLDLGCGTGSFLVLLKRLYPSADATGLDPDPKALARAEKKAARAQVAIRFDRGFANELPYADASFDRVFSSFMYHHIPLEDRPQALRELRRVLRPDGSLHLVDFTGPEDQKTGWLARRIHSSAHLKDNSSAQLLALIRSAGFANSRKVSDGSLVFGQLHFAYYRAS